MISLKIDIKSNTFRARSNRARLALNVLPRDAYNVFYKNTPIRTGNARANTKLTYSNVIEAKYPYAQRLDNGYSRQSPKGMINPTEAFIRQRLKQIGRM